MERPEVGGGSERNVDGLRIEFAKGFDAGDLLLGPFRGTAEDTGVSDGRIFVGEEGVDGVADVTGFDKLGAVVVVDSALVTKMAGFVEDEGMRRGLRAIGAGGGLGFTVVNVGIAEMLVGDADFHFVEGVADVRGVEFIDTDGSGIVRLNGDKGDATIPVVVSELLDALLVHLGDGAVVADENDDEDGAGRIVGERMDLAIDAGEREIGGGRTDGENGVRLLSGEKEREKK